MVITLLVAGAFFMENLDGTVIATALPQMARSFGGSPVDLNVGLTAYLLTLAGSLACGTVAVWHARRIWPRRLGRVGSNRGLFLVEPGRRGGSQWTSAPQPGGSRYTRFRQTERHPGRGLGIANPPSRDKSGPQSAATSSPR